MISSLVLITFFERLNEQIEVMGNPDSMVKLIQNFKFDQLLDTKPGI